MYSRSVEDVPRLLMVPYVSLIILSTNLWDSGRPEEHPLEEPVLQHIRNHNHDPGVLGYHFLRYRHASQHHRKAQKLLIPPSEPRKPVLQSAPDPDNTPNLLPNHSNPSSSAPTTSGHSVHLPLRLVLLRTGFLSSYGQHCNDDDCVGVSDVFEGNVQPEGAGTCERGL